VFSEGLMKCNCFKHFLNKNFSSKEAPSATIAFGLLQNMRAVLNISWFINCSSVRIALLSGILQRISKEYTLTRAHELFRQFKRYIISYFDSSNFSFESNRTAGST